MMYQIHYICSKVKIDFKTIESLVATNIHNVKQQRKSCGSHIKKQIKKLCSRTVP